MQEYVVVDLEMTGLDVKRERIIEIGALHICNGVAVEELSFFVNPKRTLSCEVTELTGITQEEVNGGLEEKEAIEQFLAFFKQLPLVGHNIAYDYVFLKQAAANHEKDFEGSVVDTLKLCRKCYPDLESKSLEAMCAYFKIKRERKHRALDDARATGLLFEELKLRFEEKSPELFAPKPMQCRVKKQQPVMNKQLRQIERLCACYSIIPPQEPQTMTRSEASRWIDKTLAAYGKPKEKPAGS